MDYGSMSPADFAALMGNGNRGGYGGWGDFGSSAWWIIILMLFGWGGNNRWGGGNDGYATQAEVQRGFDQQATQSSIAALQSQVGNGFADAAVAQCQGTANITSAITNGQYATAQAITGAKDTINGTLQTNQLATYQGLNQLAMTLQNGFCENRAGLADLKYTVAAEACADRQAVSDGLRDIIANNTANTNAIIQSQNAGFQGIQNKLCQLEIDSLKSANEQLRTQLNMANLAASQAAQTAQIIQDNNAQTANLIRAINPAPIPAYQVPNPVTGCCGGQGYFGCGCAG